MGPTEFTEFLRALRDKGKAAFREEHGDRFLFLTTTVGEPSAGAVERTAETVFQCYKIPLDEEPVVVVGRKDECDICIPDASVSGQHATLRVSDGVPYLIDAGSTNGTFVDEWKVDPENKEGVPLGDRHSIRFGSVSTNYLADELFFRFAATLLMAPLKD